MRPPPLRRRLFCLSQAWTADIDHAAAQSDGEIIFVFRHGAEVVWNKFPENIVFLCVYSTTFIFTGKQLSYRKRNFNFFANMSCIFPQNSVYYLLLQRGVAQFGRVPEWGSGGRWFESSHSDHVARQAFWLAVFLCKNTASFCRLPLLFPTKRESLCGGPDVVIRVSKLYSFSILKHQF